MAEDPSSQAARQPGSQPEAPASDAAGRSVSTGRKDAINGGVDRPPVTAADTAEPSGKATRFGALGIWAAKAARQTPSWTGSALFHMALLVALALWSLPTAVTEELRQLVVTPSAADVAELEKLDSGPIEGAQVDLSSSDPASLAAEITPVTPVESVVDGLGELEAAETKIELSDFGFEKAPPSDLLVNLGAHGGDALSGRSPAGRAAMVAKSGGTAGSEQAVAMGLRWLASVQCPDGGWSFNHTVAPGGDQSGNPGTLGVARNAATGMALLGYLGAGQTHKKGEYRRTVRAGLYYLIHHLHVEQNRGSWLEVGGNMYSHGIASIAMCEAYAMTKDKSLQMPAQQAIHFICYAQDPLGGGWRYQPHQPGDTSVVGWQLMALQSGYMGYLVVPPLVVKKASVFLDYVQEDSGSAYGYTGPGRGSATTAIGLLCRMYLGWQKDHSALERGVQWLSIEGPSKDNLYYDYYATQVMRHYEGPMWERWNTVMRDHLVETQATAGHEKGSWFFPRGESVDLGGRLYCTAMATMILEVYYRHLPIYRKQSVETGFPLD